MYFQVILDNLVKPDKAIVDFRTEITGISAKDLEGITCSLTDIKVCIPRYFWLILENYWSLLFFLDHYWFEHFAEIFEEAIVTWGHFSWPQFA